MRSQATCTAMKRCESPPVSGWVSRSSRRYARRRSSSDAVAGTPSTSYGDADMGLSGIAPPSSRGASDRTGGRRSSCDSCEALGGRPADLALASIRRPYGHRGARLEGRMSGFWGAVAAPERYEAAAAAMPNLEVVHEFTDGPMPTGVTVSRQGRIFVNYPKWGDEVAFTVGELRDGEVVPFPDQEWNSPKSDDDPEALVSVQSVVVDPDDRLWILDTGSPMFQPTKPGGPKLVCVDLAVNEVRRVITFPDTVALPASYLNDVRFDLRRGRGGAAYITDSSDQGPN